MNKRVDKSLVILAIAASISVVGLSYLKNSRDPNIISPRKETFTARWCNTMGFVGYTFREGKPYCYDEQNIAYPMP